MDYSVGDLANLVNGKTPSPKKQKAPQGINVLGNVQLVPPILGALKKNNKRNSGPPPPPKQQQQQKRRASMFAETAPPVNTENATKPGGSPPKKQQQKRRASMFAETAPVNTEDVQLSAKKPGADKKNAVTGVSPPKKQQQKRKASVIAETTNGGAESEASPPKKSKKKNRRGKKKPANDDKPDEAAVISPKKKTTTTDGKPKAKSPKNTTTTTTKTDDQPEEAKRPKKTTSDKNAAKRVLYKQRELTKTNEEEEQRSIYVGNLKLGESVEATIKLVKAHFKKYGTIETVRCRGIPIANPNTPRKVAAIKSEFNPKCKVVHAYIKFADKASAQGALAENGQLFQDKHLRVRNLEKGKPDTDRSLFVGNLPFDAEEEELWQLFQSCGAIEDVHLVRNKVTRMGIGIGYVNFAHADSIQLALEMDEVKLRNRVLRVAITTEGAKKKKKLAVPLNKVGQPSRHMKRPGDKTKQFQGSTFADKNKKKRKSFNKGEGQKKRMIKKIAPK